MQAQAWRRSATLGLAVTLFASIAMLGCVGGDDAQDDAPTGTAAVSTPTPTASATASPMPSATPVSPSGGSSWPEFREVIERLVPQSSRFRLYIPAVDDPDHPSVDFVVFPASSEGRLHLINFSDRGETFLETYREIELYKLDTTVWAKLGEGEPPLMAGSPSPEVVEGYVDFYLSGEPRLTQETFWNVFDYAEQRMGASLGEGVTLLRIDYEDEWSQGNVRAGGIRIEATLGDRHAYLGVLYGPPGSPLDGSGLVDTLGPEFHQKFAVPDELTEETENEEWGYANHIWFASWQKEQ